MSEVFQGWVDDQRAVRAILSQQELPYFDGAVQGTPVMGSGRGKVALLYEAVQKTLGGQFNTRYQKIGDCFVAGTPVSMADGSEKPIEDVCAGEWVVLPSGRVGRVRNTIKKAYSGTLVTFGVKGLPELAVTATPDHRMLAYPGIGYGRGSQRRTENREPAWQAVDRMDGVRTLVPYGLDNQDAAIETLDLEKLLGESVSRYAVPETTRQLPGRSVLIPAHTKSYKNAPRQTAAVDENFARLLGLYLAEGGTDGHAVTLWFSREEQVYVAEAIELFRTVFGVRAYRKDVPSKPTVTAVQCNSTPLAKVFAALVPGNVYTKRVPAIILRSRRTVRLATLRGWMNGDGHDAVDRAVELTGVSSSAGLRYDMCRLALSCGLSPTSTQRPGSDERRPSGAVHLRNDSAVACYSELTAQHTALRVRPSRVRHRVPGGLALVGKILSKTYGNCDVYCLDVDDAEHAFIAGGLAVSNCVSMGAAYAVDVLRAIQYVTGNGEWVAETATEPIYAMSRVEIGRGALGSSDGSTGAWAAEAVKKLGTLVRKPYGTIDLTTYSGDRARTWGLPRAGCPDELEPIAREHLVRTVSLVRTWDELCDAVAAGYPVTIASTVGFANQTSRDSEGFLKPSGSWAHQMCVIGLDDAYRRPGALIINSWGPWISGPKRHNQPDGSFWADRSAIERILAANDSWAYSDYLGFPLKKLDWSRAY